jgi:pyruvyl transferase EpsO
LAADGRVGAGSLVASLGARVRETLGTVVPRGTPCAVLDFPNYPNVGDSAIWLGGLACLRSIGARIVYTADLATYSPAQLAARLARGVILLSGGGNFGDLWPHHQRFRERVVADFPDRTIIQLPQSLHFRTAEAVARAREALDRHPDLTLLVRDTRSLELARATFRAPSLLCPDLAFALGALPRSAPGVVDILWLSRTDAESATPARAAADVEVVDWIERRVFPLSAFHRLAARHPGLGRRLQPMLSLTRARLARTRLDRGRAVLSHGRVVITDRLHGHVLSLLLGLPHVLLDDRHGKLRAFHDTWTRASGLATWADSADAALGTARALVGSRPPGGDGPAC